MTVSFIDAKTMKKMPKLTAERQLGLYETLAQGELKGHDLREFCDPAKDSTAMFLDLDFRQPDSFEMLGAAVQALIDSVRQVCGIESTVLVARTENSRGAHLYVVDRFWAKVAVKPRTKKAVIERFMERSGLGPEVVDRVVRSLRIIGALKMESCSCRTSRDGRKSKRRKTQTQTVQETCSACRDTGRVQVGNPFSLRCAVDSRGNLTDLSDLPLAVALELTRITWFPDLDNQPV
jgi:hypothetical protein